MREQNAALGVSLADLVLPDTLEAYAAEPNFGDAEEPPPAESKPEDSEDGVVDSGTPPESSSAPDSTPPESEKPESTPPQSSSFEANSTPPESSSSEVNSTPPEGEKPESTPPESSSSEANSTPPESSSSSESAPAEPPSESSEPAASEPESVPAEPAASGEAPNADEPAAAEEAPSADEPATRVLAAYVQSDIAQADGEAATPAAITVEGITWESTPEFDGDTAGTYTYTAVLPSGYALAGGVAMPAIIVRVGQADRLRELLDALPLPQDATAGMFDPDEAAIAAWKELHSGDLTNAQEALALFDALQADEKAALAPADIEKLEGWRELVALFCTEGGNDSEPLQLEFTSNDGLENTHIKEIDVPDSLQSRAVPVFPEVAPGSRIEINPEKTQYRYQAEGKLFPKSRNFYFELTQAQYDAAIKGNSHAISVRFRGISKGDNDCKFTYYFNYGNAGSAEIPIDKKDWVITFKFRPYALRVGTNRLQIYADSGSFYSYNGGVVLNSGLTADNTSSFNIVDHKSPNAGGGGNILFQNTMYRQPAKYTYVYNYYVMRYNDESYSYKIIDTVKFTETVAANKAKTASHKINISQTADKDTIVDCWLIVYNEAGDVVGSEGIAYRLRPDGLEMLLLDHTVEPQPKNKTERTIKVTSTKLFPEVQITGAALKYSRDFVQMENVDFDANGKADILLTKEIFSQIYRNTVIVNVQYLYKGESYSTNYEIDRLSIDTSPPTITINPQTLTYYSYTTQTALNKDKTQIEAELLTLVEYNDGNPADEGEKLSISSDINTAAPGKYTATITGKDYYGNTSTLSVPVNLVYPPTIMAKPTVTAGSASNPTCTFNGTVTEMGGASPNFGFVVGYGATPTVDACAYNVTATGNSASFSATQRVLPNVQYYLRAYVKNGADYVYSDEAAPFSCGTPQNFGTLTAADLTVLYNHNAPPNILTIPVTRLGGSEGTVTLSCALEGTSKASLTSPTTLTFGNGETTKNITISLTDQDQFSGIKSFKVKLTNPSPTTINGGEQATLNVTYSTTNKLPQPEDGTVDSGAGEGGTLGDGATTYKVYTFTKDVDVTEIPVGSRVAPVSYVADFALMSPIVMGLNSFDMTFNMYNITGGAKTSLVEPDFTTELPIPEKNVTETYSKTGSFMLPDTCTTIKAEFILKVYLSGTGSINVPKLGMNSKIANVNITAQYSLAFEGFTFDNSRTYYPGDVVAIYPATNYSFDTSKLNGTNITVAIGGTSGTASYDAAKGAYLYTVPQGAPAGGQMLTVSKSGGLTFSSTTPGVANGQATWDGSTTNVGTITIGGTSSVAITNPTSGELPRHEATVTVSLGNVTDARYAWSASATTPATGWQAVPTGGRVTGSGYNGTMYLHVSHTYDTGRTSYASSSFAFKQPAFAIEVVGGNGSKWQKSTVGLNFTKTAGAQAPLTVKMLVDGTPGSCPPDSILISDSGRYTFTATDAYGFSKTIEFLFYIDTEAPTAAAETDAYLSSLTYPALKIPVSFGDTGGSGVGFKGYAFTGSATAPAADSAYAAAPAEVTYTETNTAKTATYLHLRVSDIAGNVTTKTFGPFGTQKPPASVILPTMTAAKNGASINYTATKGTYDIVMLNGAEYTSGALSGSVSITECGYYRFDVLDAMGNIAEKGIAVNEVSLENDPPDLSVSVTDGSGNPLEYGTYRPVVELLIDVSDQSTDFYNDDGTIDPDKAYGSGVKTVEVSPDDGTTWVTATKGADGNYHYNVPKDGSYLVRVTDQNGNVTQKQSQVKNVDADKPLCNLTGIASGWTTVAQTVTVSYSDAISGIDTAQYAITTTNSGTKPTTLTTLPASGGTVSVATNGQQYIYYKVTDKAGNINDGYSAAIKVDTATPTLAVTGGETGAASLTLTVASTFGGSGGKVTVSGAGSGDVGNSYNITAKGIYTFTATANNGLTATTAKTVYSITFNSNGGSTVAGQLVVSGGKATAPTNPTKKGFTFAKWKKGGADFNPASDTITADTALTAVWTLNAPTVSLAADKTEVTYNGGNTVATLTASPSHPVAGATYAYEWYKGSTKVSGATGKTLELKTVADGGSYIVKVTASDGTLTSQQAESGAVSVKINKADTEITTQPTGSGITYGQSLSNSTLIGGAASQKESSFFGRIMKPFITSVPVPGVFSWTDGSITPAVSDSIKTEYSVTFTPTDTANYNTSTTTQKLAVGRKQLTPSVNTVSDKTYDGNTDAVGTIRLDGAVLRESPAASGTFAFTDKNAGRGKNVNVTGITLDGTWGANYALDKAEFTNVSTTAEIIPKTIGLSWSGHTDLVYTGTPVDITAAATGLIEPDICAVTVTDGKKTDAGAYTATAAALDNGNYKLPSSATQSYTIAKAPVTFVVTNNVYDYESGTSRAATVAQTAGETPSIAGSFKVSYEKDGNDIENPTDVDVYDVLAELTDQNFKHEGETDSTRTIKVETLTIKGIAYPPFEDGTMTWPAASELIYGETLSDSTLSGGNQADKGTYAWKTPADIPMVSTQKAMVRFTPTDTNYSPAEKEIDITVIKATPTLALPTAEGIIYGDTLTKSAITGGSAKATYNGADTDVPGAYTWTTPTTMPAVADGNSTEYDLTFTPTDTDNYNVVGTGKIKLAVDKKAVGLQWHGDTDLTYTGNPVNVTATATGLVGSDVCAVTVTGGTETNAGTHTATVTALANGNYKLPGTGLTQDYTIAKAPVTFTVKANEHNYDSTAKAATVAQTAGETPSIAGSFKVSYKKDGNDITNPTDVDVYDVLAELTDQNFKHENKADSETKIWVGLLTINGIEYPNADTMTWPTAAKVTYGQPLNDSALTGGDQAANGSYAWKDDAIIPTVTNGGYTVVFTPTDTNYAPVEHTVSITVAKATAVLTLPTAAGITYGNTLVKSALNGGSASATYNGADKAVPGKYTWTTPATMPKVSDSNSTEYGLTFTPTDTANYNVVGTGKIKLAVAQKPVGLTWAGYTALVYSGAPVSVTATATGLVGSDACTVTVTDGAKTDAGTYTATAAAVSNANYKLPDNAEQAYTIAKKPIKVLWSNMFPTYDGTAKTPTVTLDGVVGGEDCTVVSTGSAAAGNAGRYKVAAALLGARSGNYTMQNPNEILVIQSAPVSVSLSDYSYKYDGAAKYATVTALPNVPTTVTYKLAGNAVAAPTEEGIYDIIVELNGKNYRFADGSDGKARRMGALTIYKEKPPELYTITFDKGAEDAAGTAPTLPPSVRDTVHFLPNNSFLRAGHAFVGWKNGDTLYQPGERFSQPANNNTIFTAQWEAATYDIGGVVDQDGKPVANVRVVLMRGAEQVAETVTNQIGEYRFDSVLPGLYNLVAIKPSPDGVGDIIMTIMVEVKAADVEQANITLPSGKTNSIVEVAPGTPKIIVGNLDQTFKNTEGSDYTPEDKEVVKKGGTVEIKFSAKEKQKDEIAGDAEEITKEAGRAKIGLYLSLDVEKTVTQPTNPDAPDAEPSSDTTVIPETSVLLESVIPLPSDLQGKQSYTVYRVHEGTVDSLTTGADSGERIEVSEDKTMLVLYAQKYSTYAIAYTEKSSGGNGSGGSNNGDDNSGAFTPTGPEVPAQPETSKPEATQPEGFQPDNKPNAGESDKNNGNNNDSDKNNDKNDKNGENERADSGSNDAQKDEIRDALEDAIKNLPDTLTDKQRQEYIDRLTAIADAAIAALEGTNEPGEAKRIAQQAQKDMKNIVTEALALADGTAKPFVLASALFALAAVLLAVFALLKRKNKRRGLFSAIFAAFAVIAFLLTSGWSGFALANWWTVVVAAFAIGAALGVFVGYSKDEQPQTK